MNVWLEEGGGDVLAQSSKLITNINNFSDWKEFVNITTLQAL